MDEIDIEQIIQNSELELIENEKKEFKPPIWWKIGIGLEKAETEKHYIEAKRIYLQFINFTHHRQNLTIEEMFAEFTQMKIFNKLS